MKRVIFSMILVAAFIGCTKRIDAPVVTDNVLRMNASQSDFVSDDTTSADTRATETAFQSGDAIGLYLHTAAAVGASGNHSSNMKYLTINAGGSWQAASSLSGALVDGTTYKATGYYPYKIGVVNPLAVPHAVEANQSAPQGDKATALEGSDFMIAMADVKVNSPQSADVTLNFKHLLTKLVVRVVVPSVIENVKVTGVKSVTISGLKSKCAINLATQAVTPADPVAAITPRLVLGNGTPGDTSTWEAIVVPQSVAASTEMVKFVCDMEGGATRDLTYTVPASTPLALNSGKKLTLTLSSSADLAFTSSIDLVNGEPKINLPLTIKTLGGAGWTLTSGASWLTIATTSGGAYAAQITGTGTGVNQTVYVKVDANNTAAAGYVPRSAALTLSDNKGATATYRIVQNYTRFDPSTASWNLTAAAGQAKAVEGFTTNQLWTATPTDVTTGLGLKLATSATIGTGVIAGSYDGIGTLAANTLFMQVAAVNNTNGARTGKVTVEIKASNPRRFIEIPVTQAAPVLTDFMTTLAAYSGTAASWSSGNKSVTPASGLRWSITGDAGLTVAPTGAQSAASTAVSVSVGANNTNSARTFNYYLDYGALDGVLKTPYAVTQAAPDVATTAADYSIDPAAYSGTFNNTALTGVIWKNSVKSTDTWLTVTNTSNVTGTGAAVSSTISATVNPTGASRVGTFYINYGTSLQKSFTVTQAASTITGSNPAILAQPNGSATTLTFATTAGLGWTLSNVPAWLTPSATSGTGPGSITLTATENATGAARSVANLTVTAGSIVKTFTVTQNASTITISTPTAAMIAATSSGVQLFTVTVGSGTPWTVTNNSGGWLTNTIANGTGNGAAQGCTFAAAANNTATARSAVITVAAGGKTVTCTVTQAVCALYLSATAQTVAPHVTSTSFNVTSSSNQQGITYTPAVGTNATSIAPNTSQTIGVTGNYSGVVTVNFAANTGAQRNIIANIGYGTSLNLAHTITQQAAALTLSAYTANVGVDATSTAFTLTSNVPYTSAYSAGGSSSQGVGNTPPYNNSNITLNFPAQGAAAAVARNHTMTITPNPNNTSSSQVRVFTATQAARNPTLSLSATGPGETVPKAGKTYSATITANTTWNTTSATNVTVSPSSGTGNTNVTITVAKTTAATTRTVSVVFNTTFGNGLTADTETWSGTQEKALATWATANLGASNPQDYGNFYKWGDTFVYNRISSTTDGMVGTNVGNASTSPTASGTGNLGYDYGLGLSGGRSSGDPCKSLGNNYRTPTRAQFQELVASGQSAWTTYQNVNGYFFGPSATFCTNTTIQPGCYFFPAAGYREWSGGSLYDEGSHSYYWSSSAHDSIYVHNLGFRSDGVYPDYSITRGYGLSVRCVQQ